MITNPFPYPILASIPYFDPRIRGLSLPRFQRPLIGRASISIRTLLHPASVSRRRPWLGRLGPFACGHGPEVFGFQQGLDGAFSRP